MCCYFFAILESNLNLNKLLHTFFNSNFPEKFRRKVSADSKENHCILISSETLSFVQNQHGQFFVILLLLKQLSIRSNLHVWERRQAAPLVSLWSRMEANKEFTSALWNMQVRNLCTRLVYKYTYIRCAYLYPVLGNFF